MWTNIKPWVGGAVVGLIAVLASALKIQSSRLDAKKKELEREKLHKKAAQEAAKELGRSESLLKKVKENDQEIDSMSDSAKRDELRKYARD